MADSAQQQKQSILALLAERDARIAGHNSIAISARYVQLSEEAVLTAMARLVGTIPGTAKKVADTTAKPNQC